MAAIDSSVDPSVLRALVDQPPAEAMAYLESKGLRITFNWQEMLDEAHARAFTVAKAMRLDVLRDIRSGLLDALREGKTLRQFQDQLTPLLQSKGWWGKQVVVGGDGQAQQVQMGSPHRLKTIYQTNLQSAYMAGRAKAQMEAGAFPYLMYVAVMDGRTRPSHAALNGRIWRKDDPVWQTIFPPNGFNCRCRTRALTAVQMQREGLTLSEPSEILTREISAGTDQATGETFRTVQTGVRVMDANGKPVTMWVDPGFNASPLAGRPMDELLVKKAAAALGDPAGYALARQTVLSDTRMKAWGAFVENTFESGISNREGRTVVQNQSMTAGVLPLEVARAVVSAGLAVSPVLYVEDALLVGRKAARHELAGNALTREEWGRVPQSLQQATYYIEVATGNLMLVWAGDQATAFKAAFDRSGKMDTAFRVSHESITAAVSSGQWKPV